MRITQKQRILNELIERKSSGLNSYSATYDMRIKQAPTRIRELREDGYEIRSITQRDGSVNWVLEAYPPRVVKNYRYEGNKAIEMEQIVQERIM